MSYTYSNKTIAKYCTSLKKTVSGTLLKYTLCLEKIIFWLHISKPDRKFSGMYRCGVINKSKVPLKIELDNMSLPLLTAFSSLPENIALD